MSDPKSDKSERGAESLTSPAELVAILRAAKLCGDKALQQSASRMLRERFGMRVTFIKGVGDGE